MFKLLFNKRYQKDKQQILNHNRNLVVYTPEEDMIIKEVSNRKYDLIIKEQSPLGKFFTLKDFQVFAVDNSHGLAITEKFMKLKDAHKFLMGTGVAS